MSYFRISTEKSNDNNILKLPHVTFSYNVPFNVPQVGIIAGGRPPSSNWLLDLAEYTDLWTADSGLDQCFKANILPDVAIGDFDSASIESITWAKQNNVHLEQYPVEKDLTDLQLCLKKLETEKKGSSAIITGCWGGRFDHAQSIVFSCLGYTRRGNGICCMADEKEVLLFLEGGKPVNISFDNGPDVLSLLSFSETCRGINLKGTFWELENTLLKIDEPWAISNRLKNEEIQNVTLGFENGWLGLYLGWH